MGRSQPWSELQAADLSHGLRWVWGLEILYRYGHHFRPVVFSSPL